MAGSGSPRELMPFPLLSLKMLQPLLSSTSRIGWQLSTGGAPPPKPKDGRRFSPETSDPGSISLSTNVIVSSVCTQLCARSSNNLMLIIFVVESK